MPVPARRDVAVGAASALVTVSIWAGWIVATRHSVTHALGPVDVGLLRFGLPAVVLAPVWLRCGLLPHGVSRPVLALMVCGSGVLFQLVAASGLETVPPAAAGVLLTGTMPLWAALIGRAVAREPLPATRRAGVAVIAAGVALLAVAGLGDGGAAWPGAVLLPLAALLWAGYTHAFRRSGLSALQGAAVTCAWSALAELALIPVCGTGLVAAAPIDVTVQLAVQGGLSGLVAIVAYGVAVRRLGAAPAAAFSALAPLLAALGGALFLGDPLPPLETAAALVTGAGVLLASGLMAGAFPGRAWYRRRRGANGHAAAGGR